MFEQTNTVRARYDVHMPSEMPAVPWHKSRREETRQPLGVESIVEAGIRVLDAEGLSGFSMRRVAQDLGTGPASLYAHVSGRDELLELMLDRISAEVRLPEEPDPARWKEQLKEVCRECQRVYTSHRDISVVSLSNVPTGPNQLRITEFILDLLVRAGVPEQVAAWALDRLALMLDADAVESYFFTDREQRGENVEEWLLKIRKYFSRLPADRFPRITAMQDVLTTGGGQERFEFGLEVYLRGLETFIEPRPEPTE